MQVTITKELLQRQIKIAREFLKEGGYELNQSSAYNMLSKMYGQPNWNTLCALIEKDK